MTYRGGGEFLPPMAFRVTENGMAPQGLIPQGEGVLRTLQL